MEICEKYKELVEGVCRIGYSAVLCALALAVFMTLMVIYGFSWHIVKSGSEVVRIRRFTGATERLVQGHWTRVLSDEEWQAKIAADAESRMKIREKERIEAARVSKQEAIAAAERRKHEPVNMYLNKDQLSKIQCSINACSESGVWVQVYNGLATIPLTEITVRIGRESFVKFAKDKSKELRLYRETCNVPPLSSKKLYFQVADARNYLEPQDYIIQLESAAGMQKPL